MNRQVLRLPTCPNIVNRTTSFIASTWKASPMAFPYIGIFHIFCWIWVLWGLRGIHFGVPELISMGSITAFSAAWLAIVGLKKWGAFVYLLLTLADVGCYVLLHNPYERTLYVSAIFPIDAIFCFFILFYFKRFTQK